MQLIRFSFNFYKFKVASNGFHRYHYLSCGDGCVDMYVEDMEVIKQKSVVQKLASC